HNRLNTCRRAPINRPPGAYRLGQQSLRRRPAILGIGMPPSFSHRFCQQLVVDLPRAPKFEPLRRMPVMPSRRFSSMMSVLLRMTDNDAQLGASRPGAGHSARLSAPEPIIRAQGSGQRDAPSGAGRAKSLVLPVERRRGSNPTVLPLADF